MQENMAIIKKQKNSLWVNIAFAVLPSVIAFIISLAMICPIIQCIRYIPSGDVTHTMPFAAATSLQGGVVDAAGNVILDGNSEYNVVNLPSNGDKIGCFVLNLAEPIVGGGTFLVESSIDGTFTDVPTTNIKFFDGDTSSCVSLEEGNYCAIRIWFDKNCRIANAEFYDGGAKEITSTLNIQYWRYILVLFITVGVFVISFFVDYKKSLSSKLIALFKASYMKITTVVLGCGIAVILGIVTEICFRLIFGADSIGNNFNTASCSLICAIYILVFAFISQRKNICKAPENAVLYIILSVGILIILSQPFSYNSFDVDAHYRRAINNSFFRASVTTDADMEIIYNKSFSTVRALSDSENIKLSLNRIGDMATGQQRWSFSLAHLPSGIFIAVARLFHADFYTRYIVGQLPNLIIYAIVVYFAIKKLKSGKMILATLALLPTNIFIAANYSYDYWVNAFAFLGTAYYISELEQPDKPVRITETIIMCLSFALAAIPKQIYVMLLVLPFFMLKNWRSKKDKKTYYAILIASFVFVLLLFVIRAHTSLTGSGDTRGGAVNPTQQVAYIFSNPLEYTNTLISFLSHYLSTGALGLAGYTTFFAYLGNGKGHTILLLILCITVLTDKNYGNKFKRSWLIQIINTLLLLGGSALIATALYIAFTPVGLTQINGCQPRYIVPILLPFLLTITNPGLRIFKNKGIYNLIVLLILTAVLIYNVATIIAIPMM